MLTNNAKLAILLKDRFLNDILSKKENWYTSILIINMDRVSTK